MTTLIVGFDSAWTRTNAGAFTGVLQLDDGTYEELGPPRVADFEEVQATICDWQTEKAPNVTIVMLDQPIIVKNNVGQRPVENLVGASVSRRYGGVQPAYRAKTEMFGDGAPIWAFLSKFGGPGNPRQPLADTRVIETYPVLAMIALDWVLPAERVTGHLPKYNPERTKTFSISDWRHVCRSVSAAFSERALGRTGEWIDRVARNASPRKSHQDCVDACVCLLAGLHLIEGRRCLMVGDIQTGYMVVPYCSRLHSELVARCCKTGRAPSRWVRVLQAPKEQERNKGKQRNSRFETVAPGNASGKR